MIVDFVWVVFYRPDDDDASTFDASHWVFGLDLFFSSRWVWGYST